MKDEKIDFEKVLFTPPTLKEWIARLGGWIPGTFRYWEDPAMPNISKKTENKIR